MDIYLDSLTKTLSQEAAIETLSSSYDTYRALSIPKPTYRKFLQDNALLSPGVKDEDDWWSRRLIFLDLLSSSSSSSSGEENGVATRTYDAQAMITKLAPFSHLLLPETIVLYGRVSRHEDALSLLVSILGDFAGGVEYCLYGGSHRPLTTQKGKPVAGGSTRGGLAPRKKQEELFALLLVEVLKMGDWVRRQEWVEMLLQRYAGWLDVLQVLEVLPDEYSVRIVGGFLVGKLRELRREKGESAVGRALGRGVNLRVSEVSLGVGCWGDV